MELEKEFRYPNHWMASSTAVASLLSRRHWCSLSISRKLWILYWDCQESVSWLMHEESHQQLAQQLYVLMVVCLSGMQVVFALLWYPIRFNWFNHSLICRRYHQTQSWHSHGCGLHQFHAQSQAHMSQHLLCLQDMRFSLHNLQMYDRQRVFLGILCMVQQKDCPRHLNPQVVDIILALLTKSRSSACHSS